MKIPMTTAKVMGFYKSICISDVESHTCSVKCKICDERIWFHGSLDSEQSPANFACPYCGGITINEAKIYRLYKERF